MLTDGQCLHRCCALCESCIVGSTQQRRLFYGSDGSFAHFIGVVWKDGKCACFLTMQWGFRCQLHTCPLNKHLKLLNSDQMSYLVRTQTINKTVFLCGITANGIQGVNPQSTWRWAAYLPYVIIKISPFAVKCQDEHSPTFYNQNHHLQLQNEYFLETWNTLTVSLSLSPSAADSLPWRVQVQGEFAPKQLQRLRVSGVQRLLHSTQQAWPREEGQQGYHCHDCDTLPTPNMTSKKKKHKTKKKHAITNLFAHVEYFPGNINTVYIRTNKRQNGL